MMLLKNRFRKEIILILIIKLCALFVLWALCFSEPVTSQLTKAKLVEHFMIER